MFDPQRLPPGPNPSVPTVRNALRDATAGVHERLDAWTSSVTLSDRVTYGRFLQAQSGPVLALEAALEAKGVASVLPDWPLRSRGNALRHDLEILGIEACLCPSVVLTSEPRMFGSLYVLEGSRLGARFLLKQALSAAPDLQPATEFLRHGEGQRFWPAFLQVLESKVAANDLDDCIRGALDAFALFEHSFRQILAPPDRAAQPEG